MAKRRGAKQTGKTKGKKQPKQAQPAKQPDARKKAKPGAPTLPARPRRTADAPAVEGRPRLRRPISESRRLPESVQPGSSFAAAGPNTKDARPSFEQFFQQIADGVVKAQRSLDTVSAKYLEDARRQPHVLPSVFRIPRVSAEAKFALESTDGTTVSLVFFKKTEEAKTRHQQSVQFDVMAVPPPPELRALPFQLPVVVDPALRAAVLGSLKSRDWPQADAVLILNLAQDDYLLIYAGATAGQVAVRHVRLVPGAEPKDATLHPLGTAQDSLKPLWETVTALGQAQRGFLAGR